MRRVGTEADVEWAKALHRGQRMRLFPEWSMWVGLTVVTLFLAAPLIGGILSLAWPSLLSRPVSPLEVIPYMVVSLLLLCIVAAAWGQKLHCAIQLAPAELRYWDWRNREHRVRWDEVKAVIPHLLLWRITLRLEADGVRRNLALDYGADVRREAIVSEIARRADLETERPLPGGAPVGSVRWRRKPPPPSPRRRKRSAG